MKQETDFMMRAIELAKKGCGKTVPNPCVGCVIVKDGKIIGEGWHKKAGSPHAEIMALKNVGGNAIGSTMYVTLEPCCHFGRTPPCTDAIIKSGARTVVAAMIDPSPHADGKGIAVLRKAGVKVRVGLCRDEAREINQVFLKNVLKRLPYVTLKVAMSLDGKIASWTGDSRGISCKESLKFVHKLRSQHDAVLVGIGTILADDPHLGTRLIKGKSPVRVILDERLRIPLNAKVLRNGDAAIFVSDVTQTRKIKTLENRGIKIIRGDCRDIRFVLKKLFALGITSVLIEGGEEIFTSFIEAGAVDRYIAIIAPKLIGGAESKTPFGGKGMKKIADAHELRNVASFKSGGDVIIEGFLNIY